MSNWRASRFRIFATSDGSPPKRIDSDDDGESYADTDGNEVDPDTGEPLSPSPPPFPPRPEKPKPEEPNSCSGSDGKLKSVDLSFKLLGDSLGGGGGYLSLKSNHINAPVYSPTLLVTGGEAKVKRILDSTTQATLQFLTFNEVVEVVDTSSTDERYVLNFYHRDPAWTAGAGLPLPVTGTPHTIVTIENPDRTFATHDQLTATHVSGGKTTSWNYNHTISPDEWTLVSEDGTRTEKLLKTTTGDPAINVETRTVLDENDVVMSKTVTTVETFTFGNRPISEVVDPDGKALTTTWEYYEDAAVPSSEGQIKLKIGPSGAWTRYEYHPLTHNVSKIVQGYLGTPTTAAENLCRVTTYQRSPSGPPAGSHLETVSLAGQIVSRRFIVQNSEGYDDIQCLTPTSAWNAAGNLVTKRKFYSSGEFRTKPLSVIRPDGTATFYEYQINEATLAEATELTTIVTEGQPNVGLTAIVAGTETTTLTNQQGHVIFTEVRDIESGETTEQVTTSTVDEFGRPTEQHFLDGTAEFTSYGCCGLESKTDRNGVSTSYTETPLVTTRTSQGITFKTTEDGREITESRVGTDSVEMVLSSSERNVAGQLVSQTSSSSGTTTMAQTFDGSGNTVLTSTFADGGTKVETLYPAGAPKSVTGTSVAPLRYEHGTGTDGSQWAKVIALDGTGADTSEWVKSYRDMAGRTWKREYSNSGTALTYFNVLGQLNKTTDADGVATLYTYDARGRLKRQVLDMDQDDVVDEGGTDRITEVNIAVTTRPDDRVVERTTQTVWTTDSNASATAVVRTTDRAVDGLDSWTDTGGLNSHSQVVHTGAGAWTETTTSADDSKLVRTYTGGRLVSEVWKDDSAVVIATKLYRYDAQGRLWQNEDGRGAITTYAYNSGDQVLTLATPAPTLGGTAPVTTYAYDAMGRQDTITDAAGGVTDYDYWPTGSVKEVKGNRAYPITYTYTAQGRMESMATATGTTTWVYHATSGLLWKKLDDASKGPLYTYTSGGRLLTQTNARTTVATYGYTNAGEPNAISYSDGITAGVSLTYNRLGQRATTTSDGITCTLATNVWGQLESESWTGGVLSGLVVTHSHDGLKRRDGVASALGVTALTSQTFGYDGSSRLETVTGAGHSATYAYDPDTDLLTSTTLKEGASLRMTTGRSHDLAGRLDWIKTYNAASAEMFKADYAYNNIHQRENLEREDGSKWVWGYNARGEVTSGSKRFGDGTPQPVLQYGYSYDGLGNRLTTTSGGGDSSHTATYTPNSLNQYVSRTVPSYLAVTGEAATDANVVVQGGPAARKGTAFWREWSVDNLLSDVRENLRVIAAKPGAGTAGADLVRVETGKLYLAPAEETFIHDDDGNLTSDARWTYAWDAENRLIGMEEKSATLPTGWVRVKLTFVYDPYSRRTRKTVHHWDGSAWQVVTDTAFVYDGWNLLAELDVTGSTPALLRSYAWGLDLSQSLRGAGGVGGLLWAASVTSGGTVVHYPAYDGNGNVIGYVDGASGTASLKLDYDPFGNAVVVAPAGNSPASSEVARSVPFRFSTKYGDAETGLAYYGYRYYTPSTGRWLSRDPIAESGGINLYGMTGNHPVNSIDVLGEDPMGWPVLPPPNYPPSLPPQNAEPAEAGPLDYYLPFIYPYFIDPPKGYPRSVWAAVMASEIISDYLSDLRTRTLSNGMACSTNMFKAPGTSGHTHLQNSESPNSIRIQAGLIAGGIDIEVPPHDVTVDCSAGNDCLAHTTLQIKIRDVYTFGELGKPSGNIGNDVLKWLSQIPAAPYPKPYIHTDQRDYEWQLSFRASK